jgi:hypothetical protein
VTYLDPIAAPFTGRRSGTWHGSGLPARCGGVTKGKVRFAWKRSKDKLVAGFDLVGLK